MNTKNPIIILTFAISTCIYTGTFAQNVVTNGDFLTNASSFVTAPGYAGGGSNPLDITGWTANEPQNGYGLNGPGTSLTGTPFAPSDAGGNTFLFIQKIGNFLSQDITLAPNTEYILSFDGAARAGNPTARLLVTISDDTTTIATSGQIDPSESVFTNYTFNFTTPSSFTGDVVLRLINDSGGTGGASTVSFANVSVAVPEPSTYAAMYGMLALIMAYKVRRQRRKLI